MPDPLFLSNRNWPRLSSSGTVQVWRASLDVSPEAVEHLRALLTPEELERTSRYRFPIHRDRFIVGRGYARRILGQYTNCPPDSVRFRFGAHGKPEVEGVSFNVAHADAHLLVAIGTAAVGIDIEARRTIAELEGLVEQVFSESERDKWSRIPVAARPDFFLKLWTRKEALLKGIGLGITQHLKDVSVYFDEESIRPPAALAEKSWAVRTFVEEEVIWSVAMPGLREITVLPLVD